MEIEERLLKGVGWASRRTKTSGEDGRTATAAKGYAMKAANGLPPPPMVSLGNTTSFGVFPVTAERAKTRTSGPGVRFMEACRLKSTAPLPGSVPTTLASCEVPGSMAHPRRVD